MKRIINKNIINIFILIFFIISILSINKASIYISKSLGNLYIKQIYWYIIGIIILFLIQKINILKLYNYSIIIYILNTLLLLGLLLFGEEINNTKAWFRIFNINIQPSEFMKISLILINSYIINKFYKNKKRIKTSKELLLILELLIITIIPSILTFLEPDTGAIIGYFVITISMLYISGIDKKWFIILISILLISLIALFIIYFYNQKILINIFGYSLFYRIERIINWKNKIGMQLNNSLIAIGSSSITGHNKVPIYYPEAETDFIFTSFTSSFGLLGGIAIITTFLLFNLYIIRIIKSTKRKQNAISLFGILVLFTYQEIQNISMTIGLLPITGITLPLISYGGSSIISNLILLGIVKNIEKKAFKPL